MAAARSGSVMAALSPPDAPVVSLPRREDFVDLTLDPNTAHESWLLSDDNRTATLKITQQSSRTEKRPVPRPRPGMLDDVGYHVTPRPVEGEPDRQSRFRRSELVMASVGLTGRSYFEVAFSRDVDIAMTYRPRTDGCDLGDDNISWSLRIYGGQYYVCSLNVQDEVRGVSSDRVGVYLDHEAGILSFYEIKGGGEPSHLHTFREAFREPLYPAFGVWVCTRKAGASVSLVRPL